MRVPALPIAAIAIPLLAFAAAPVAGATTLQRLDLAALSRAANIVVHARCKSSTSRWDGVSIWTFVQFDVLETLKGAPPPRITVRLPGGRVGHLVSIVDAVPRFLPGEEGYLFLEKTPFGDYSVTAWAEGSFRVQAARPGAAATVTQDSSRFPVFDGKTHRFQNDGIRHMPLTQFRERLAAALAGAAPDKNQ